VHLVGFTIEIYYDARSYIRQICVYLLCIYFIAIFKRAALCAVLEILFRTSLNVAHMQQSKIKNAECLCEGKGLPVTCYEVREVHKYPFLISSTDGGRWSTPRLTRFTPWKKTPRPIVQEVVWAAGTVWTVTTNLAPYRGSNPGPSSL